MAEPQNEIKPVAPPEAPVEEVAQFHAQLLAPLPVGHGQVAPAVAIPVINWQGWGLFPPPADQNAGAGANTVEAQEALGPGPAPAA